MTSSLKHNEFNRHVKIMLLLSLKKRRSIMSMFRLGGVVFKISVLFFSLFLSIVQTSHACTIFEFIAPSGNSVVAHNLDWSTSVTNVKGAFFVNARNTEKEGELFTTSPLPVAKWTSLYGSVTFSLVGREFPAMGVNEKGLMVAMLMLPETQFPGMTDPRPMMSTAQWVQIMLDRAQSLNEVIAITQIVRPSSSSFKTHYFACDMTKSCAAFQYLDGELKVFKGYDLPYRALTNSTYALSRETAEACPPGECQFTDNSLKRFVLASQFSEPILPIEIAARYGFESLNFMVQEFPDMRTQFQVVSELNRADSVISYKRYPQGDWADFSLKGFKFDCSEGGKYLFAKPGQKEFQTYDIEIQKILANQLGLPPGYADFIVQFPERKTVCKQ